MLDRPRARPPPAGRYNRRGDERRPAELGQPTRSSNVRTTVGAIQDPYEPDKRLLATVNRRVDILEHESSHDRITEAALRAGRWLQGIYEQRSRMMPSWPGQQGSHLSGDQASAAMHGRLANMMDHTDRQIIWVRKGPGGIGEIGEGLLRHVLGDRMTYTECALLKAKSCACTDADVTFVAKSFRNYLECVADMRAARGRYV